MVNLYLNNLVGSRVKLSAWLVKCSNNLLKYITREDFKEKFLSELRRSLLRNPEIIMQTLSFLLEDLTIDLSDFSSDLVNALASQLISKDELIQNETAQVFKSLASQCSSQDSIQQMLKHLFKVLNGGEGKLSTSNQKISILTAIGNCSSIFSESSQDILIVLFQLFADYLKTETHEPSQVFCLQQLNKWLKSFKLQQFSAECVKKLNEFFKSLIENKSYSNMVRAYVYQSMASIYSIPQLVNNIANFSAGCMSIIDKAHAQVSQNNLITYEALSASLLLAIYLANDISNGLYSICIYKQNFLKTFL